MAETTSKLSIGSEEFEFAVKGGSVGPDVIDIGKLYGQTGMFTLIPALLRLPHVNPKSPILTATKAFCCIADIRSINLLKMATFWKSATCCFMANCRPRPKRKTLTIA